MPNGLYRWEDSMGTAHHCAVCHKPLSVPENKRKCIGGLHEAPCSKFHQNLFKPENVMQCMPCRHSREEHRKRHKAIAEALFDLENLWLIKGVHVPRRETENVLMPIEAADTNVPVSGKEKKRAKKLAKEMERASKRPRVLTAKDIEFVSIAMHPGTTDETEENGFLELLADPSVIKNAAWVAATSETSHKAIINELQPETPMPSFSAEVERVLVELNIIMQRDERQKQTRDLAAKIRRLVNDDYEQLWKEEQQTIMRRDGFLRWIDRSIFYKIVEDRQERLAARLNRAEAAQDQDEEARIEGYVNAAAGLDDAADDEESEPSIDGEASSADSDVASNEDKSGFITAQTSPLLNDEDYADTQEDYDDASSSEVSLSKDEATLSITQVPHEPEDEVKGDLNDTTDTALVQTQVTEVNEDEEIVQDGYTYTRGFINKFLAAIRKHQKLQAEKGGQEKAVGFNEMNCAGVSKMDSWDPWAPFVDVPLVSERKCDCKVLRYLPQMSTSVDAWKEFEAHLVDPDMSDFCDEKTNPMPSHVLERYPSLEETDEPCWCCDNWRTLEPAPFDPVVIFTPRGEQYKSTTVMRRTQARKELERDSGPRDCPNGLVPMMLDSAIGDYFVWGTNKPTNDVLCNVNSHSSHLLEQVSQCHQIGSLNQQNLDTRDGLRALQCHRALSDTEAKELARLEGPLANSVPRVCYCRGLPTKRMVHCAYRHCNTGAFHARCVGSAHTPPSPFYCWRCMHRMHARACLAILAARFRAEEGLEEAVWRVCFARMMEEGGRLKLDFLVRNCPERVLEDARERLGVAGAAGAAGAEEVVRGEKVAVLDSLAEDAKTSSAAGQQRPGAEWSWTELKELAHAERNVHVPDPDAAALALVKRGFV